MLSLSKHKKYFHLDGIKAAILSSRSYFECFMMLHESIATIYHLIKRLVMSCQSHTAQNFWGERKNIFTQVDDDDDDINHDDDNDDDYHVAVFF